jgi:hypothetical protein
MIEIIGLILVSAWYASSATKRGFNPVIWAIVGCACYLLATFIATYLIGFIIKYLPIANEVKAFIQIMGLAFNIVIGLAFCYWVGRQFGFKLD